MQGSFREHELYCSKENVYTEHGPHLAAPASPGVRFGGWEGACSTVWNPESARLMTSRGVFPVSDFEVTSSSRRGVWGVGCGVWGVGCGVWGVGCGVWGVGCRV